MVHCGDDGRVDVRGILADGVGIMPASRWRDTVFSNGAVSVTDVVTWGNVYCL